MDERSHPTESESIFLELAFNKFHSIFYEVFDENFWSKDEYYRFSRIKEAFSIYGEVLNYEPIKRYMDFVEHNRPPMQIKINKDLFRCMRNLLAHFPLFDSWKEVWFNFSLINWYREGQSIDRFLRDYEGHEDLKLRFWEESKKKMTYVSISFPDSYLDGDTIYLNDILNEEDGFMFALIMMKEVINSQIES